jgi:mono/diheme cytochrome c family protein
MGIAQSPAPLLPSAPTMLSRFFAVYAVGLLPFADLRAADKPTFNRDIRPLLSDACFQCHGPDAAKRKAGLRLDIRADATIPAKSGETAIVPGKPEKSELLKRVAAHDDTAMPPDSKGKRLTKDQIALLTRWIADGADYQGHWAFLPVERPKPPAAGHPVDAFIRTKLAAAKLKPQAEADRTTLIRRVTLDLTGLPPTPAEVQAFLADKSPNAYEVVVDRLLKSPRYGEHMALQWLDFARYADSNGFQVDSSRFQWPWRNWVIDAFNTNKPFDQFTVEQIAGDLLPNATRDQIVATGFNRNHRLNGEGGLIAEEWRIETVIDRLETTGSTWLGLTFNCCRCHDHKYDPITQKEFYRAFAYFNSVQESGTLQGETRNTEPTISVPDPNLTPKLAALDADIGAASRATAELLTKRPELQTAWEAEVQKRLAKNVAGWKVLEPKSATATDRVTLTKQPDGSYLAAGANPAKVTYEIVTPLTDETIGGLLLEAFTDSSLPGQSVGRAPNGNFVLSRIEATLSAATLDKPVTLKFNRAEADYSQNGWDIKNVLNGKAGKGWAVDGPTRKENRKAMFLLEKPVAVPKDATLTVRVIQDTLAQHSIGRFRLSATSLPATDVTLAGLAISESLRKAIMTEAAKRSPEQKSEVEKFYLTNTDGPVKAAVQREAALKAQRAELMKTSATVMVMKEAAQPRDAFVLLRGEYDKKGEKVTPGTPASLPPMPKDAPQNRLGLARWLVDDKNPLTARVWVNRAWERFFGTGLVKTSENLGSQSEFPSHPELLDWLAAEFMSPTVVSSVAGEPAKKWDMKAFHKLLVTSDTYRQANTTTAEAMERDPDNRLLARSPRLRLSGEALRDQALFTSGLLVEKVGGPSVRPYMPDGVWDETSRYGDLRGYKHDTGDGLYRRSLYTVWKRTAAPPTMLLFDAPSREYCTVKRSRTNTPLQALSLLNEVTYVEAGRKLGERMLKEGGTTDSERIRFAVRVVLAREPSTAEEKVLLDGLIADRAKFAKNPAAVTKLLAFGDSKPDPKLNPAELATATVTANILLNLDEAVVRP